MLSTYSILTWICVIFVRRFIFMFIINGLNWLCCILLYWTTVGGKKYKYIIAGHGDHFLIQIACLHQFIYPFHISVVHVLYTYTLSSYISEAFKSYLHFLGTIYMHVSNDNEDIYTFYLFTEKLSTLNLLCFSVCAHIRKWDKISLRNIWSIMGTSHIYICYSCNYAI